VSCGVAILLFSFVFAQNDSLKINQLDSALFKDPVTATVSQTPVKTNDFVYKINGSVDIPITVASAAWTLYAFTKIYNKPHSSVEKILSLNKNDINGFDRWAVRPWSKKADQQAYYTFDAAIPLPLLLLTDKKTRRDFGKLTFLWFEAMSITGILYTSATYFNDRYRPYAYSPESPMDQRVRGGAKNSFYAGHVALVATSSFFMAHIYADYHPDSKVKWLMYTLAGAATGYTAYMRYKGGQHFPSDILLGITEGTLCGLLVPHFHKHPITRDPNLSFFPYSNGQTHGLALVYKLN
jgi:membrane-associated phospholipid phosphatase